MAFKIDFSESRTSPATEIFLTASNGVKIVASTRAISALNDAITAMITRRRFREYAVNLSASGESFFARPLRDVAFRTRLRRFCSFFTAAGNLANFRLTGLVFANFSDGATGNCNGFLGKAELLDGFADEFRVCGFLKATSLALQEALGTYGKCHHNPWS